MTNIGDGGVQLKIDSFEKNLLKCKKMISYYLQLNYHQDSNKLSKKETEVILNVIFKYLRFVKCCYHLSIFHF